jgi:muramoyltetrapeptide carboxypeptidase
MGQPRVLKKGDTIGIAAPASPFDRNKFQKGVRALEGLGFKTHFRKDIYDQNRYFAGTEARRAEEFMELVERKGVAAIMFARGGYGSQRVIPFLDAAKIAEYKKPVIGFSDLTALLTFLRQSAGLPTMYGPVVTQLAKNSSGVNAEALTRALTSEGPLGEVPSKGTYVLKPGRADGPLVGGCISLINSSIGTPYELKTDGAILFLEDTGEKVYVLDRMLTQLRASGALDKVRGIVFGSLTPLDGEPHDADDMINDVLVDFEGPIVKSFPAGHGEAFVTLPLGVKAELDASDSESEPRLAYTEGLLT